MACWRLPHFVRWCSHIFLSDRYVSMHPMFFFPHWNSIFSGDLPAHHVFFLIPHYINIHKPYKSTKNKHDYIINSKPLNSGTFYHIFRMLSHVFPMKGAPSRRRSTVQVSTSTTASTRWRPCTTSPRRSSATALAQCCSGVWDRSWPCCTSRTRGGRMKISGEITHGESMGNRLGKFWALDGLIMGKIV